MSVAMRPLSFFIKQPQGFSIPEIAVSLLVCSFVSLSALHIFRADQKIFVEQEEVVDMQQNARIAMDQLIKDIRVAGMGVPSGGVASDVGHLFPVIPGNGGGNIPDTITLLASFENIETQLSAPMPNESAELKVTDASEFEVGALGIIYGAVDEGGQAGELFQITHISTHGQHMLQHRKSPPWNKDQKLSYTFIPPSTIYMMSHRKYFVDSSDNDHPKLIMSENEGDPLILADNIENLQLTYDLLTGEMDLSDPQFPVLIRKVTVSLVARTNTPDPQWNNGIHSITGAGDNYRRLILKSDVFVRNTK